MDWSDDSITAAQQIAAQFETLGVRYLLGGSMASSIWSEPRFTRDVDMVADLKDEHVVQLLAALGDAWYADETSIRDAIARKSPFHLIRFVRMVKVDVFVPPDTGFHANKWGRARRAALSPRSDATVAITAPEDIVLQKLEWFRSGGEVSELQWRDVVGLLRNLRDELDAGYLDEWASQMGLDALLARARNDAAS